MPHNTTASRTKLLLTLPFCLVLLTVGADAQAGLTWTGAAHRCVAPNTGEVTARLDGIPWGQSWEDTCAGKVRGQRPPDLSRFGATGQPLRCEKDAASTGIWGKWRVANDPRCYTGPRWEGFKRAGCFGPNRQVYSAQLMNARDWDADCRATDTSRVAGKTDWGAPDRCVRGALNTGIWGEWYTDEACATPLQWGSFKDNGCVKDMETADANLANVTVRAKRSYSAVMYNAGGDWAEACRFAPARVTGPSGQLVGDFEHPTACVMADADRALGYVMGVALGGLSGLATSPTNPKLAVAVGAAVGAASTAATEALLAGANTSLNIWGIFWVDDARCGEVPTYAPIDGETTLRLPTGQLVQAVAAQGAPAPLETAVARPAPGDAPACPANALKLRGTQHHETCACSAQMTRGGRVWGSGPYTDDSNLCRAAVHAGVIPASGGVVSFAVVGGGDAYAGSTRHGVVTSDYGPWPGAVIVTSP